MTSGVYQIQNWLDDKVYIGSSTYMEDRLKNHETCLKYGYHRNQHLQNAWDEYGFEMFNFTILEATSKDNLLEKEQFWMDKTRAWDRKFGYNIIPIAGRLIPTPESNKKKSESWCYEKHFTEKTRRKLSLSKMGKRNPRFGASCHPSRAKGMWHPSEETRRKMREASKGKKKKKEEI